MLFWYLRKVNVLSMFFGKCQENTSQTWCQKRVLCNSDFVLGVLGRNHELWSKQINLFFNLWSFSYNSINLLCLNFSRSVDFLAQCRVSAGQIWANSRSTSILSKCYLMLLSILQIFRVLVFPLPPKLDWRYITLRRNRKY